MKKRGFYLLLLLMLTLGIVGCSEKKEVPEKEPIQLKSEKIIFQADKKSSDTGEYQIKLEFKDESPICSYIIYENGKEFTKSAKQKEGSFKVYFDVKEKVTGSYKYKIEVVDGEGSTVEKTIEVIVELPIEEPTVEEQVEEPVIDTTVEEVPPVVPEPDVEEEEQLYQEWNPNLRIYKKGDIVTYKGSEYVCITKHISFKEWTPTEAHSLWEKR